MKGIAPASRPARRLAFRLGLLILLALPLAASAQRYVTLVDFTNTYWKFDDTRSDLGTAWRTNDFDDSLWPGGTGLFGVETNVTAYPFPFVTPVDIGPNNDVTTNIYFRAHFNLDATNLLPGLALWASNYVDDGCVIYLNGLEAARLGVPGGNAATTYASSNVGGTNEGTLEYFQITTNLLRVGDNVLAVEVHQGHPQSTDLVWGMYLTAIVPTSSLIITQPQSQTVEVGNFAILCVETAGGPVTYQWQTNNGAGVFFNIPGATRSCYTNITSGVQATDYRVLCTAVNPEFSSVATVTVVPDRSGPRLLYAEVNPANSNRIELYFDGILFAFGTTSTVSSAVSPSVVSNNFRVTLLDSNVNATVNTSSYVSGPPSRVSLFMASTNWHYRSNYAVILNNIRDFRTNVIAPYSIAPLIWPSNATYGAYTSSLPPFSLTNEIITTRLSTNLFRLAWPTNAYGWALERSTNVIGPWLQVQPHMANPYITNSSARPYYFYRLHATQ
jgi:hypothetical protein